METRQKRATPQQFSTLLEFMESHGDLGRTQLGLQGRIRADRLWLELTNSLNSINGGVHKSSDKWKKVWIHWKAKTKKKSLEILGNDTSGGPKTKLTLHAYEKRLLSVMGLFAVEDYPGIEEKRLSHSQRLSNSQSPQMECEIFPQNESSPQSVQSETGSPPPCPSQQRPWMASSPSPDATQPQPQDPLASDSPPPSTRRRRTPGSPESNSPPPTNRRRGRLPPDPPVLNSLPPLTRRRERLSLDPPVSYSPPPLTRRRGQLPSDPPETNSLPPSTRRRRTLDLPVSDSPPPSTRLRRSLDPPVSNSPSPPTRRRRTPGPPESNSLPPLTRRRGRGTPGSPQSNSPPPPTRRREGLSQLSLDPPVSKSLPPTTKWQRLSAIPSSPSRRRRKRRPFDRATNDLVFVQLRRLQLKELRERQLHEREMRRIEVDQERNQLLRSVVEVAQTWLEYLRGTER